MPIDHFRHSFVVDALPSQVYAHLIEPENYVGLSPLVVTVRDVHRLPGAARYVAVERFRFGPFRWDNHIHVEMHGTPDRRIVSDVSSPGGIRLNATVDLRPVAADPEAATGNSTDGTGNSAGGSAGGTEVTEVVEISTPWLLRSFAIGQARKVQQERAAELTRRMRA